MLLKELPADQDWIYFTYKLREHGASSPVMACPSRTYNKFGDDAICNTYLVLDDEKKALRNWRFSLGETCPSAKFDEAVYGWRPIAIEGQQAYGYDIDIDGRGVFDGLEH